MVKRKIRRNLSSTTKKTPQNETLNCSKQSSQPPPKKIKRESGISVIVLLDRNIYDNRINQRCDQLSRIAVAKANYKFMLLSLIQQSGSCYSSDCKRISKEFLADSYFVRKVVSFGYSFHSIAECMDPILQKDTKFILDLLQVSKGESFSSLPEQLRNKPIIAEKAVCLYVENMKYTDLKGNQSFVKEMIKINMRCLPYVDKKLLCDQQFMISILLEHNIKNINFLEKKRR